MKIAVHVVRTLLAALFLWASLAYFFNFMPEEKPSNDIITYMTGINMVHLLTIAKSIELICGVLLLLNVLAPLANVILFPLTINIFLVHLFLGPEQLPMVIAIILVQLFLAYAYRKNYAGLFTVKPLGA